MVLPIRGAAPPSGRGASAPTGAATSTAIAVAIAVLAGCTWIPPEPNKRKRNKDREAVTLPLTEADAHFEGAEPKEFAGSSVASRGDVDGDGIIDLLVGAPGADTPQQNAGKAYLFAGPLEGEADDGDAVTTIEGEFGWSLGGHDVAMVRDLNGDGRDEIVVTALQDSSEGFLCGAAYLFYGPPRAGRISLESADVKFYGRARATSPGAASPCRRRAAGSRAAGCC